jgi:hypothetical protein
VDVVSSKKVMFGFSLGQDDEKGQSPYWFKSYLTFLSPRIFFHPHKEKV